ncbi:MAG: aromatic amino acid lyase, partial [Actinomycetota bacterium]
FVTTGGFHAVGLAAGMDALAVAAIQGAELAAQRVHRLLDGRFSGLADQLSPTGRGAGLIAVHKRTVGVVAELRRLASPGSVGLADTSMGQEDAMTFAFDVAERLRRVEELAIDVVACELLAARQAWALRGGARPPGLRGVAEAVCSCAEPVTADRPLGADIESLASLVRGGSLLEGPHR